MERITGFSVLKIKMEGFKKFKEPYEAELDKLTQIFGGNGQGKTTVADAIAYAFCGTPFWGEKSSDRLQNPDCKEMCVTVRFVDQDGEIHTLSRRRNGSATNITLDTVSMRQADLTNIFVERDVFLSLLNPLYFIEKIAEDGREFLQRLMPPVKEDEVMALLSDSTKALLEGEHLSDPEYYIRQRREELKELDENRSYLEGQIDLLKNQQKDAADRIDGILEQGNKIVERKAQLEQKQFYEIDVDALKARQAKIAESLSDDKRSKALAKQAEAQNRRYESKFTGEIAKVKAELESLTGRYQRLVSRIKAIKVGDVCPTCRTVVTEENYGSICSNLKKELSEVCQKGQSAKEAYQELLELDRKSEAKFQEFRDADVKRAEAELAELEDADVSEIALLEDKIRLGNLTHAEYEELTELAKQADAFSNEVAHLAETDQIPEKIAGIEKSLKEDEERGKELRNRIHAAGEFAAKKAEIVLSRLEMNHAAIKLFDVAKTTGELKNVFRFTYDGKDYRWLSTSEKIKAGLEVSKLLERLTGLVYPTYIDNAECITTKLEPMYGQIILAYAKNTELAFWYPRRETAQVKEAA